MGNTAYDFERFAERQIDEEKVERRRKIAEVKRNKKMLRQQAVTGAKSSFKVVLVSAVMLVMVSALMFCRVRLNEINDEYERIKQEIMVAESDNVRLKMELDAKASIYNIDDYATQELGMQKIQENQINYIDLSSLDDGALVRSE